MATADAPLGTELLNGAEASLPPPLSVLPSAGSTAVQTPALVGGGACPLTQQPEAHILDFLQVLAGPQGHPHSWVRGHHPLYPAPTCPCQVWSCCWSRLLAVSLASFCLLILAALLDPLMSPMSMSTPEKLSRVGVWPPEPLLGPVHPLQGLLGCWAWMGLSYNK